MPGEEGGYYAIKGFEYQIDKTIFEILKSEDQEIPINIEQIQDIDSDNWVMQVKYKETAKFVPSAIKKPVIQLLDEYISNNNKKYYLYCYFGNLNGYDHYFNELTLENLNSILGSVKNDYLDKDKVQFLLSFRLVSAPEFQKQFDTVISLIQAFEFCHNYDEAVFYYSNVVNYIRKKIVLNSINQAFLRTCTKSEIVELLNNGRKLIFDSAYLEYLGKDKYEKKINKDFIPFNKRQMNIILFGNVEINAAIALEKLIADTVESYYNKATYDIQPLTFVIKDEDILKVKKYLIENEISFNDGYEHLLFNKKIFFEAPIINKKTIGLVKKRATDSLEQTSYKLRVISEKTYKSIESEISGHMYYYFDDINNPSGLKNSYIYINRLDTHSIRRLIV